MTGPVAGVPEPREASDQEPTDHAPTDHAPTDHAPTDEQPTGQAPTDPEGTGQALTDQALLTRLGAIVRTQDPVPEDVRTLGRAAFALRALDAELAELVADSSRDLAGVRSASQSRLLTFQAAEVVLELMIGTEGTLLGQLVGAERLWLDTATLDRRAVPVDEHGSFRVAETGSGAVRLVVATGGRSVTTGWFHPEA